METVTTPWQTVELWTTPRAAELRSGGAVHAWWHRERLLTGLAWDALAAAALLRPAGPPATLLMLGVAGGTAMRTLRHLLPDLAMTGVELDPDVLKLARRHLALEASGAEIVEADALDWLAKSRRRFDVVIDDCYLGGDDDVARSAWTPERQQLLEGALAPGGLLAVNLVNSPGHEVVVTSVGMALRREFPVLRRIHPPDSWNEILVVGDGILPGSELQHWSHHFSHPTDRRYWRRLRVEG